MVERYHDKESPSDNAHPFRCDGFSLDGLLRDAEGEDQPIAGLPPFLRALLVTDGTVTKILEAYYWEPIAVHTLEQAFIRSERRIPWIQIEPGDSVLLRKAQLLGCHSGRTYVQAQSLIRVEGIPGTFRQRLIDREIGIGVLIRDSGLESYREVLEVGIERAQDRVFRTYRILMAGTPTILITERFPLALYRRGA